MGMYSKYERRTDTRTYEDRKKLYEGGWEVIRAESLDAIWKEKYEEWSKRPGKKAGDAETPEGEEAEEAAPVEEEEEFEEEEEEEENGLPPSWRNNLATSAPKNIPDWFLLQTICF